MSKDKKSEGFSFLGKDFNKEECLLMLHVCKKMRYQSEHKVILTYSEIKAVIDKKVDNFEDFLDSALEKIISLAIIYEDDSLYSHTKPFITSVVNPSEEIVAVDTRGELIGAIKEVVPGDKRLKSKHFAKIEEFLIEQAKKEINKRASL